MRYIDIRVGVSTDLKDAALARAGELLITQISAAPFVESAVVLREGEAKP